MRIVVQDTNSKLFLKDSDTWVVEEAEAKIFSSSLQALNFCWQHGLVNESVSVFLDFGAPRLNVHLHPFSPLGKRSPEKFVSTIRESLRRQGLPQLSQQKARRPGTVPLELQESLREFVEDHPVPGKVGFIMMRFGTTPLHKDIGDTIKATLYENGLCGVRADDKDYHENLFDNIRTYMHGCGFGIAVFERLERNDFNPNVALEVGYMVALRKPVFLLKDQTLKGLHADLIGKLYKTFDTQEIGRTIPPRIVKWLRDRKYI